MFYVLYLFVAYLLTFVYYIIAVLYYSIVELLGFVKVKWIQS
jgi:hypothetical protein